MSTNELVADFLRFWETHFPEQQTFTRADALSQIDEDQRGLRSTVSDLEMVPYQDDVARVYGAYEDVQFQEATVRHLIGIARGLPDKGVLVSLGCGPASYELWLLGQTKSLSATLVDYSPGMLARAREIAERLGVAKRVKLVESDAGNVAGISSSSAELLLCLNSMHWSANWMEWIKEAARVARRDAPLLATCTFGHPRSMITPEDLAVTIARCFDLEGGGLLVPPTDIGGGMVAMNARFYTIVRRK